MACIIEALNTYTTSFWDFLKSRWECYHFYSLLHSVIVSPPHSYFPFLSISLFLLLSHISFFFLSEKSLFPQALSFIHSTYDFLQLLSYCNFSSGFTLNPFSSIFTLVSLLILFFLIFYSFFTFFFSLLFFVRLSFAHFPSLCALITLVISVSHFSLVQNFKSDVRYLRRCNVMF